MTNLFFPASQELFSVEIAIISQEKQDRTRTPKSIQQTGLENKLHANLAKIKKRKKKNSTIP